MTLAASPPDELLAALSEFRDYGRSLTQIGTDVLEDFLAERRSNARAEEDELR